ncbi:MAG: rRNA maturation RNase YbeY [Pseudomonadota bacterium]
MTRIPHIDIGSSNIDDRTTEDVAGLVEPAIRETVVAAKLRFPEQAELSILLADDTKLRELNHNWRKIDKATNVLSFPGEDVEPGQDGGMFLGDIAISIETTNREAVLENKRFNDHFTHLIVHGFLHLFGYDHENESQAMQMEALETAILAKLGIADPYENGQTQ